MRSSFFKNFLTLCFLILLFSCEEKTIAPTSETRLYLSKVTKVEVWNNNPLTINTIYEYDDDKMLIRTVRTVDDPKIGISKSERNYEYSDDLNLTKRVDIYSKGNSLSFYYSWWNDGRISSFEYYIGSDLRRTEFTYDNVSTMTMVSYDHNRLILKKDISVLNENRNPTIIYNVENNESTFRWVRSYDSNPTPFSLFNGNVHIPEQEFIQNNITKVHAESNQNGKWEKLQHTERHYEYEYNEQGLPEMVSSYFESDAINYRLNIQYEYVEK